MRRVSVVVALLLAAAFGWLLWRSGKGDIRADSRSPAAVPSGTAVSESVAAPPTKDRQASLTPESTRVPRGEPVSRVTSPDTIPLAADAPRTVAPAAARPHEPAT